MAYSCANDAGTPVAAVSAAAAGRFVYLRVGPNLRVFGAAGGAPGAAAASVALGAGGCLAAADPGVVVAASEEGAAVIEGDFG